jgi:hypothetical protein
MKGIIYCILDNSNGKYYIGSTNLSVGERLQRHENNCKMWIKGKYKYTSSYEIIQNNNYKIYLIKELEYDEDEEEQLLWLERKFIEDGIREGNCVNKNLPIITEEEKNEYRNQYRIDNREEILEYQKQYHIDNREEIKEYMKQYRIDNRDKIKQYYIDNREEIKEQNKQYRIDNRDKIKQYKIDNREEIKEQRSQYRIDNRDKINEKFDCLCGGKYTLSNKARHEKSITHQDYLQSLLIQED